MAAFATAERMTSLSPHVYGCHWNAVAAGYQRYHIYDAIISLRNKL